METEGYNIWAKICGKTGRFNVMSLAQMGHTFWVWCMESTALMLIKSQTCALKFIHPGHDKVWLIHLNSPINSHTLLLTTIFWVVLFCAICIKPEGTTRKNTKCASNYILIFLELAFCERGQFVKKRKVKWGETLSDIPVMLCYVYSCINASFETHSTIIFECLQW